MTTLSQSDRVRLAWGVFSIGEAGAGGNYVLTYPHSAIQSNSGLSFGVNQIDLSSNGVAAAALVAGYNNFVLSASAGPVSPLLTNQDLLNIQLKQISKSTGANNTQILSNYANSPSIVAYLASPLGRIYVDVTSRTDLGTRLLTLQNSIGQTSAGQTVLNDPAMFSLILSAINNIGNVKDIATLFKTGSATFASGPGDGSFVSLTPTQLAGNITFSDLQGFILHSSTSAAAQRNFSFGGLLSNAAQSTATEFLSSSLPAPTQSYVNAAVSTINGGVTTGISTDNLSDSSVNYTMSQSSSGNLVIGTVAGQTNPFMIQSTTSNGQTTVAIRDVLTNGISSVQTTSINPSGQITSENIEAAGVYSDSKTFDATGITSVDTITNLSTQMQATLTNTPSVGGSYATTVNVGSLTGTLGSFVIGSTGQPAVIRTGIQSQLVASVTSDVSAILVGVNNAQLRSSYGKNIVIALGSSDNIANDSGNNVIVLAGSSAVASLGAGDNVTEGGSNDVVTSGSAYCNLEPERSEPARSYPNDVHV